MLDVEYLLKPPVRLERTLVYRYRTGMLRSGLIEALSQIAERDGNLVLDCSFDELCSSSVGGGLFQGIGICDWPEDGLDVTADQIAATLEAICRPDGQPVVLFVSNESALLEHPLWSKVEEACDVIHEPVVSPATLLPILTYLESRSVLVPRRGLLSQREFLNYFENIVGQDPMNLPELRGAFDRVVLLFVDPDTGLFSGESASREQQRSRSIVMRPLRAMVERRDSVQLPELLRGLAVRFPSGRRGGELADELARHTQTLLKLNPSSDRQRGASGNSAWSGKPEDRKSRALVWACIVLIFAYRFSEIDAQRHTSRFRVDQTLVLVDELGRDFLDRTAPAMADDPLVGLWAELRTSISLARASREETDTSLGKGVRDLVSFLTESAVAERPWVARLLELLTNDANAVTSKRQSDESSSPRPVSKLQPQSFVDVIGHQVAVQGLQQRISSDRHSTPLVLCGPEGVGKRTLGRIYANRLLCEGALNVSGSPCGKCPTCKEFETGSPFDFIEFDAGSPSAVQYVQEELLNNLRFASMSGRRAVMVTNPDSNPQLVEICLKTLEKSSAVNSFIFTVTDVRGLSGAGQSRSEMYRLAALTPPESRRLAESFLGPAARSYDSQVLDVIVAESGGLPRRLQELCYRVASTQSTTLDEVRSALGLGWAGAAISFWRLLLAQHEPVNRRSTGTPYRHPKGTPLIGVLCW
ncbi:hypothetical protein HU230_0032785 [Bradyrhizobium quebecense]|uniref:Uncharacterized protein n=1 Tax=Bradyrhizobium quebecense TaxID=2748629 RepID=A0A973WWH2_9BRAD|nr:hypothetical protein [Bradyrhizobium quebecense]UGA43015.1 hypothetical protein HU230_0032785 [Bradyrhizobium quebecense]